MLGCDSEALYLPLAVAMAARRGASPDLAMGPGELAKNGGQPPLRPGSAIGPRSDIDAGARQDYTAITRAARSAT